MYFGCAFENVLQYTMMNSNRNKNKFKIHYYAGFKFEMTQK